MVVTLVNTGSGILGDIQEGWSVTEDATPIAPGDTSGGTGAVNLSVKQIEDSEFTINNRVQFQHPILGSIDGWVNNVSVKGASDATNANASISIETTLNLLNVDRVTQPLGEGVYLLGWGGSA